jgi:hypothetical protein
MGEQAITIGSVEGGWSPWMSTWREALMKLTLAVDEASAGVGSELNLNVVFQIPGSVLRPDFTGVRTGRFSPKRNLLLVQVALPEEPSEEIGTQLVCALAAAVEEAQRWANRRRRADGLAELHAIVQALDRSPLAAERRAGDRANGRAQ